MQESNDNCVVDVGFCAKSDVAFVPDTLCSRPPGALPVPGSTLPVLPSLYQRQYCIASCLYMLNIKTFSVLMLVFGLPKQLVMIRIFLIVRTTNR